MLHALYSKRLDAKCILCWASHDLVIIHISRKTRDLYDSILRQYLEGAIPKCILTAPGRCLRSQSY